MKTLGQMVAMACVALALGACSTPVAPVRSNVAPATDLGWSLSRQMTDQDYLGAVTALRQREVGRIEDIRLAFLRSGGSLEHWNLLVEASTSPEYREGVAMGSKLRQGAIEDVTIVEYLDQRVLPRADETILAFSAGFVSAFGDECDRGEAHLDALILWASSASASP